MTNASSIADHPALIGLGVCTLDFVQQVSDFPVDDQVIRSTASLLSGGGPVATAIVAASRLGTATAMIDRTGDDWRGQQILGEMTLAVVDTRWLSRAPNSTTAFASVMTRDRDGARAIVFTPGTAPELVSTELPSIDWKKGDILHLNGRHWPACLDLAKTARAAGATVSFDGGAHRFRDEILELLPHIDIAIVATEFASHLADKPADQLAKLIDYGASIAGITNGAHGSDFSCHATSGTGQFHQPAFAISPVIDTTGCGDVFHGAFLATLLAEKCPRTAARHASAAAALNATAPGGRGHLANREELDFFLSTRTKEALSTPLQAPATSLSDS